MTTDPRIEAAARAEFNSVWRGASWDGPVNPTTEETRDKFRIATAAGLAAADAVDPLRNPTEADIERAAKASGHKTSVVRAVVAALRTPSQEETP
uniref:hypothetical protein n=1 Tax=Arthrobacter silvisoli TaxID=2291022 RepID=UPI003F499B6E